MAAAGLAKPAFPTRLGRVLSNIQAHRVQALHRERAQLSCFQRCSTWLKLNTAIVVPLQKPPRLILDA